MTIKTVFKVCCMAVTVAALNTTAIAQTSDPLENFLSDGNTLVPPNCLTNPFPAPSGSLTFSNIEFPVTGDVAGPSSQVRVVTWRADCPEQNRSSILIRFENLSGDFLAAPALGPILLSVGNNNSGALLRPLANDNVFVEQVDIQSDWIINNGVSATYQVNAASFPGLSASTLDADEYQQELGITFYGFTQNGAVVPYATTTVPALSEVIADPQFPLPPLTGRHNGTWVVENTQDQGVLVSISELPSRQLVAFVAWFTYGPDGEQAWFTGNGIFNIGDNGLNMDLTRGTDGTFQGNDPVTREIVGTLTLSVDSCAGLLFDYDLSPIGLGSEETVLRRLFGGETAGYVCRDLTARSAENDGG